MFFQMKKLALIIRTKNTSDFAAEFPSMGPSDSEKAEINTEPCVFTVQIHPPTKHTHTHPPQQCSVFWFTSYGPFTCENLSVALGQLLNSLFLMFFHSSMFASPPWTLSWSLPSSPAPPASSCSTRYSPTSSVLTVLKPQC